MLTPGLDVSTRGYLRHGCPNKACEGEGPTLSFNISRVSDLCSVSRLSAVSSSTTGTRTRSLRAPGVEEDEVDIGECPLNVGHWCAVRLLEAESGVSSIRPHQLNRRLARRYSTDACMRQIASADSSPTWTPSWSYAQPTRQLALPTPVAHDPLTAAEAGRGSCTAPSTRSNLVGGQRRSWYVVDDVVVESKLVTPPVLKYRTSTIADYNFPWRCPAGPAAGADTVGLQHYCKRNM